MKQNKLNKLKNETVSLKPEPTVDVISTERVLNLSEVVRLLQYAWETNGDCVFEEGYFMGRDYSVKITCEVTSLIKDDQTEKE